MLESGFAQNPLSWLTPSLGTVDALTPIDAAPPNLKDSMCGPHRKRPATEDDDADAGDNNSNGNTAAVSGENTPQFSVLLSALRAPTPKNANLLSDAGPVTPVIVYTGPTRTQAQIANLAAMPEADPVKKKAKHKAAAKPADVKTAVAKPTDAKAADGKVTTTGKPSGSAAHWTPMSSSALATSPPPDLKADAPTSAPAPKKQAKAHPPVKPNPAPAQ